MPRAVPSNSLSFIFDVTTLASQLTQQETTSLNLETGQLLEKRNCAETVKKKKKLKKQNKQSSAFFCCLSLCTAFYHCETVCFHLLSAGSSYSVSSQAKRAGRQWLASFFETSRQRARARHNPGNAELRKRQEVWDKKRAHRGLLST